MNSSATTFPEARVAPRLGHAWGGIWRLTVRKALSPRHWLEVGAMLVILALICFAFSTAGNGPQLYVGWSVSFYFTFLVPVMAFIAAAGTMRDEMKSGTVDYVLTRPLPKPALVIFKYFAHLACAQVDFLCAFAIVVGVGMYRHAPGLTAILPSLLLSQVLLVGAFSAFGFLCGVLTSRYIIVGLLYASMIEVGIGQIPTQLSRLSMTHQIKAMLHPLIPNSRWMFSSIENTADTSKLFTAGLLIAFSIIMLALTATLFATRELDGPADA